MDDDDYREGMFILRLAGVFCTAFDWLLGFVS